MLHIVKKMLTIVWSFWKLFTFEVHYKEYQNRELTAEYLPAEVRKTAVLPISSIDNYFETTFLFSILFSFLFFCVLFFLSLCSTRFLRFLLLLVVASEFIIGRFIKFYFPHEYTQLLVLRVTRFMSVLISFFLLLTTCLCCSCVIPKTKQSENVKSNILC